jgi:hypothetical protein
LPRPSLEGLAMTAGSSRGAKPLLGKLLLLLSRRDRDGVRVKIMI